MGYIHFNTVRNELVNDAARYCCVVVFMQCKGAQGLIDTSVIDLGSLVWGLRPTGMRNGIIVRRYDDLSPNFCPVSCSFSNELY